VRQLVRVLRRLGSYAITLLMVWLAGLAVFIVSSVLVRVDTESPTDAVVVLTGGRLRLETGLALLDQGKAKKLFISGVNPRVDRDLLLRLLGARPEREACCIVLGREADNTIGNAKETAGWMHEEGYRSLRLVTSWYHMRRSLVEFGRAMPRVTIIAHPVFAHHVDPDGWWGPHGSHRRSHHARAECGLVRQGLGGPRERETGLRGGDEEKEMGRLWNLQPKH